MVGAAIGDFSAAKGFGNAPQKLFASPSETDKFAFGHEKGSGIQDSVVSSSTHSLEINDSNQSKQCEMFMPNVPRTDYILSKQPSQPQSEVIESLSNMMTSLTDVITKLSVLVSRSIDFPDSSSSCQFDNRSTELSVESPGFQATSPNENDACLGVSEPPVSNDSVKVQEAHEENKENFVDISGAPSITKGDNVETVVLSASSDPFVLLSQTETKEKTVPQNFIVQDIPQCAPCGQNNFVAPVLANTGAVPMREACSAESADTVDSCFDFATETSSISVNVREYNFRALVDTGAAVTAVSANVWNKYLRHAYPSLSNADSERVTSVNGRSLNILGKTLMQFVIGAEVFYFEAHVIQDLAYDVIIGRDFLQKFRSRIDFRDAVLTLSPDGTNSEEPRLPFCDVETDCFDDDIISSGESNFICSIHADFSFIIPPESEVVVPAKLSKLPSTAEATGVVVPRVDLPHRYSVFGASALVKIDERGSIPVRMVNPSAQPVKIYRRTRLGDFEQVNHDIATFKLTFRVLLVLLVLKLERLKAIILTFLICQIVCFVTVTKLRFEIFLRNIVMYLLS